MNFSTDLINALRAAQHVAVLTGAGVSAESGIPTFREAQTGLWAQYRPEDLATPEAFERNPKLVWDWYAWRRELVEQSRPNAGHFALVQIAATRSAFHADHAERRWLSSTGGQHRRDRIARQSGAREVFA